MNSIRFPGVNANFGAPVDWNEERDGPCGVLPVLVSSDSNGLMVCTSIWEPTAEERRAILAGANIQLSVIGLQVPVSVGVTAMVGDECFPAGDDDENTQPASAG